MLLTRYGWKCLDYVRLREKIAPRVLETHICFRAVLHLNWVRIRGRISHSQYVGIVR